MTPQHHVVFRLNAAFFSAERNLGGGPKLLLDGDREGPELPVVGVLGQWSKNWGLIGLADPPRTTLLRRPKPAQNPLGSATLRLAANGWHVAANKFDRRAVHRFILPDGVTEGEPRPDRLPVSHHFSFESNTRTFFQSP